MINVHGSLLPRWRGASPIIYAILNGDAVTGVSLMKIHPNKFDVGEILAQKSVEIPKNVLMPELHETLSEEGAKLLLECIENVPTSFQNLKQQDDRYATYGMTSFILIVTDEFIYLLNNICSFLAPKVPDTMAHIDWQVMTSKYICNLHRALYSFKWLTTHWNKRRVKIRELDLSDQVAGEANTKKLPGCIEYDKVNKCLRVYCSDGHFIRIKQLILEGKPVMTAADFNNGFLKKVNLTQRFFT